MVVYILQLHNYFTCRHQVNWQSWRLVKIEFCFMHIQTCITWTLIFLTMLIMMMWEHNLIRTRRLVGRMDGYVYRHYVCIYTHCFNVEGVLISAFNVNIIYVVQDKYILYLYVPIVVQTCINTSGSVKNMYLL